MIYRVRIDGYEIAQIGKKKSKSTPSLLLFYSYTPHAFTSNRYVFQARNGSSRGIEAWNISSNNNVEGKTLAVVLPARYNNILMFPKSTLPNIFAQYTSHKYYPIKGALCKSYHLIYNGTCSYVQQFY